MRVIWSWLMAPSTIRDNPVAVAAPKLLNK
jgi:hypothetical protein